MHPMLRAIKADFTLCYLLREQNTPSAVCQGTLSAVRQVTPAAVQQSPLPTTPILPVTRNSSMLPSMFIGRSLATARSQGKGKAKEQKFQTWDRNIVCLPLNREKSCSIPRGKARAQLGSQGLIGKIRLDSTMSEEEVFSEICSVFQAPMCSDPNFPFQLMQTVGGGSKSLSTPATSSRFTWSGKEVAKMSGQGCLYIQALKDLQPIDEESCKEVDDIPACEVICSAHCTVQIDTASIQTFHPILTYFACLCI